MKKLENLLDFEDFKASWKSKEASKTKRTETGLDIVEEKVEETTTEEKTNETNECPLKKEK